MTKKLREFIEINKDLIMMLVLSGLILAIYWQALGFEFINLDDNIYVYQNTAVLNGLTGESIYLAFTSFNSANWHPLTWISHQLDVSIFGLNAGAHHATNIILHLINTILAFVVFHKFTGSHVKSFFVAVLFAVHPAHVESVAWISERKDVLSTMFWFLTMFLYVLFLSKNSVTDNEKGSEEPKQGGLTITRYQKLALSAVFALGLMAKPMLVTLPFVLVLMDYWPLNRLNSVRDLPKLIIEKAPLFVLAAMSAVITFIAQSEGGAVRTLERIPVGARISNAFVSYVEYIAMLFYPVNLAVWYPYNKNIPIWETIGAFAIVIAITLVCFKLREHFRYLLIGWLWFVGTLVPVIGFVQVGDQALADRYTYVPYFGLLIIVVWGVRDLAKSFKIGVRYTIIAATAAVLVLSVLSFKQVSHWRSNETLYTHSISTTKGNYLLMQNLCHHYIGQQRLNEAEKQCRDSLKANQDYAEAHNSLGTIHMFRGDYQAAASSFRNAVESKPDFGMFRVNLSAALAADGNPSEAEENLKIASSIVSPFDYKEVWVNAINGLATAYLKKNNFAKAEEKFTRALFIDPEKTDIRRRLVVTLIEQEKYKKADENVELMIRQNPNDADTLVYYGNLLAGKGKSAEAVTQFERALSINPELPDVTEEIKKLKAAREKPQKP